MSFEIRQGDCLSVLRTMPDESVQCCVTSPPYFGLRDYGVDGQIGLEPTVEAYVAKMVEVFAEVKRVLRNDGVLFLNLGDSYAGSWGNYGGQNRGNGTQRGITTGSQAPNPAYDGLEQWRPPASRKMDGIKPKDLIGVPWAVAFALRSDGWYLRSAIIWAKDNPMPESVTDRPTKSYEHIFLMAKSERYYYDADAIKELSVTCDPRRPYTSEGAWEMDGRSAEQRHGGEPRSFKGSQFNTGKTAEHQLGRSSNKPRTAGNKSHKYVTAYEQSETEEHRTKAGLMKVADVPWEMRNKRDVWNIPTKAYKDAHFATFPEEIPEICIKAGTKEGDTVLDPFSGAGTSGLVATRLHRNYIGIELNADYVAMSNNRIVDDAPLFNSGSL